VAEELGSLGVSLHLGQCVARVHRGVGEDAVLEFENGASLVERCCRQGAQPTVHSNRATAAMTQEPRLNLGQWKTLRGSERGPALRIPAKHLVTHGVVVGMTGILSVPYAKISR
jgi:hypothetical protein